jgi:hypothetical protein
MTRIRSGQQLTARRTRFGRATLGAAVLSALVLLLAACSGSGGATGSSSNAADVSTPKDGGNLTFLIQEFPAGWVSSVSEISSYEGNLWGEITDKLVYVSNTGQVSPWIASSWQSEDNATKFILHLKSGVTFSDGEPLNAAAVVDNIDLWAKGDPSRGIAKVGLFPSIYFEKAVAVNSDTVEVDFSKPTLGFIPTLGYHGCILLAPKTLALSVNQQANLSNEIGSGPFTVKSFQTGVSYTLVRRKDYNWGPAALGHTGPAYLNSITYKVGGDAGERGRGRGRTSRLQRHPGRHPLARAAGLHRRDASLPGLRRRLPGRRGGGPDQQPAGAPGPAARHQQEPDPVDHLPQGLGRGHHVHPGHRPGGGERLGPVQLRPGAVGQAPDAGRLDTGL